MVSASSLQRVAICPAAGALPSVRTVSDAAGRGTALHAYLAAVGRVGHDEALAQVPEEHRAACAALDVSRLPVDPGGWAAEVAWALDFESGQARELGRDIGRNYPKTGPTEIVGTADVVGIGTRHLARRVIKLVYVLDYKSGRVGLARARDNWQLKFLALAAARTYGATAARIGLIKIDEDGDATYDTADLDTLDLDAVALELKKIMRAVQAARWAWSKGRAPRATTGDHCRFCNSLPYCQAQTSLIRQATGNEELIESQLAPVSAEAAAQAWERVKALKAVVARAEQAIYAYAVGNPIPLPTGLLLGQVESSRETVDGPTVRKVLLEMTGPQAAIYFAAWVTGASPDLALAELQRLNIAEQACEYSSSKTAIKKALKPLATAMKLKMAPLERVVLGAIAAAGGVKRTYSTSIKEFAPAPPELTGPAAVAELEQAMDGSTE